MRLLLLAFSLMLLAGCMPPSQDQLRMEMDLEQMKRRLAGLEVSKAEAAQAQDAGGDALQRRLAELSAGLDNLRVEFQSLNGRIDDLGQNNRELQEELQLFNDDIGLRLNSIDQRLIELEQQSARQPLDTAPAREPATTVAKPNPEQTPEQLYQRALRLIRNDQEFAQGEELLKQFVDRYPEHDLYVNALYWIGEALYGEKKYEAAILQFQDVISQYPEHSKAPAAMYKQALAFRALADIQSAGTTMQKLVEEYPDTTQADKARQYLEQN